MFFLCCLEDNDQVLKKVEDLGGSINNLISNESRLVAPVMVQVYFILEKIY